MRKKSSTPKAGLAPRVFSSILISFCLAVTCLLLFFQTFGLRRREYLITGLIFCGLVPVIYWLITGILIPGIKRFGLRERILLILISGLFGGWILHTTNHPPLYSILPTHTFSIDIPDGPDDHPERAVSVIWFTNEFGDVGFSQFRKNGDWIVSESKITHLGSEPASLHWKGQTGEFAKIEISTTPYSNPITITWDNEGKIIDLAGKAGNSLSLKKSFTSGQSIDDFILWFTTSFLFLSLTVIFLTLKIQSVPLARNNGISWTLYMIPMLVVWGSVLLVFYPGMMHQDSLVQWSQIISGQYNDYHPVFHTLLIWLLTRIWYSPTIVIVFQILFLSLTVAWGIRILEENGFPRWSGWLLAFLFTLAPLNSNMVIGIWKDIPYSTSLFLFSLMMLKTVFSNGGWLGHRTTWVWLGIASLFVASFRHNGLPIPIFSLVLLMFCYRKWWKRVTLSFLFLAALYGVIRGPLYKGLNVEQPQLGFRYQIMMHHISAHINTGQALTPSEESLANSILPEGDWGYDCCTALSIMHSPGYLNLKATTDGSVIQQLFFDLAIKEPSVEFEHLKCVSSIVWRSPGFCAVNTLLPRSFRDWFDRYPGLEFLHENSLIPPLTKVLAPYFVAIKSNPDLSLLIAPAIYLMLGIYSTMVLSIRKKEVKIMLFIVPVFSQAVMYLLINVSDNFRYHYAAYLVGLFGVGLLISSMCVSSEPKA